MANTVETLGDAELVKQILNKTITEYEDNIISKIGHYAFYKCTALTTVKSPSCETVGDYAFYGCTALKKVDLEVCSAIYMSFSECTALEALILRKSDGVCSLTTHGAFGNTPIVSGTGYIYVPAALVDSYKTAACWSTYTNQIRAIEDYPEVCNPYNWEAVFKTIEAGTYKDVYRIGDLIPLDLGSEGVINMRIIAFDTDNLADGSGKAPITWMATAPLTTTHRWNPAVVQNDDGSYKEGTGSIGGWGKSELRTYLNDTVKALIPANVRNAIKEVTKNSRSYDTSKNVVETISNDYLWPFSNYELKHIAPSYIEKESTGVTYLSVTQDMLVMPKGYNVWYDYWLRTADWNEKTVCIVQSHYVEFKSNETNSIYNYPHFCFCT